ncbi:hypothetical protein MJG53_016402 [Ovis ammon polii x Ovis aries]|uniref:Uncharacterized protein n=1 Tax=Ovis ammon polii x Ovis aries TaxID=2918886 RepID=A0ACB9UB40_9CETA|nr:hypothetical protein MJG53_016402 [Ovis ammon polii x Ovis aries]
MDRDLSDDSVVDLSFEADSPLAPPAELLETLPSCDWVLQGDRHQIFFPPSETAGRPQEQRCWSSFLEHRVPVVTEEVAREALLSFVNSKCCYGSAAAGDLVILELKQQNLCRYRLETFSESRISEWTFQPFTSKCSTCSGRGNKTCATCKGEKKLLHFIQLVIAWKNSLFEFVSEHQLDFPGELLAKARGETLFKDENTTCCMVERHEGAEVLGWGVVLGASGRCDNRRQGVQQRKQQDRGRKEQQRAEGLGTVNRPEQGAVTQQVYPIVDFPLREISLASRRGISEHSAALASRARVLQQRQTLELIPLTEVRYWYRGKTDAYYIYGTDHQVYVVDYPERAELAVTARPRPVKVIGG